MPGVPSPPVAAAPLYVIGDQFAALIETADLVSLELELEFQAEFEVPLIAAFDKRDRVGEFLAHLEQQIGLARFETDPLRQQAGMTGGSDERQEDADGSGELFVRWRFGRRRVTPGSRSEWYHRACFAVRTGTTRGLPAAKLVPYS